MTLQEIQERLFERSPMIGPAEDREQPWTSVDVRGRTWTSVDELDDMLHELEDVDQPDKPAVQKLRERIEALMDEIENHRDMQLVGSYSAGGEGWWEPWAGGE